RDATKLRLRIFKVSHCAPAIGREIADEIIRRIVRSFVAREDRLSFIIQRRNYGLIRFRVAAKHTRRLKCLQVQAIDEWAITFRRSPDPCQKNITAPLHDRAGAPTRAETAAPAAERARAAVATNHRRARIFISRVLATVPKFAWFTGDYPGANTARRA